MPPTRVETDRLVCYYRKMAKNGAQTRARIMDAAEGLILDRGFAGTSVDAILERAGLTKGAFFHHFPTKTALAHALVERYAALDAQQLEEKFERAERLSRDPLQQVLIFVGLFEESMDQLVEPYPGCLFASYCYQAQLFDAETLEVSRRAMARWRERLAAKLGEAARLHPPRLAVEIEELADQMTVILEGSFIVSSVMSEPGAVAAQLRQYRSYLELLFDVAPATG